MKNYHSLLLSLTFIAHLFHHALTDVPPSDANNKYQQPVYKTPPPTRVISSVTTFKPAPSGRIGTNNIVLPSYNTDTCALPTFVDQISITYRQYVDQCASLPLCGHVLLFSAPRHGSTWLIDSIEGCRFRKNGRFVEAALNTEVWVARHKKLANVSVDDALSHLKNECSLKIFPVAFGRGEAYRLIEGAFRMGVPMIVLRRSMKSVYVSWKTARRTKVWNVIKLDDAEARAEIVVDDNDGDYLGFAKRVHAHFERVWKTLHEIGVLKVDVFEYEDIRGLEYVVAEKNGCYIRNCNYVEV